MSRFNEWQLRQRASIKIARLLPMLQQGQSILDIGTGNGAVCQMLMEKGFHVTPADIRNKSRFPKVKPVLFDGENLPFAENSFEICLLLTVLHHAHKPDQLLQEAVRVSSTYLIIIEDVYTNAFQKYLTFFMDSLVNLEIKNHPHNNRTSKQWEQAFDRLGLKIIRKEEKAFLWFFRQATYLLKKR